MTSLAIEAKLLSHADAKSQPTGYKPALSFKGYAPDNGRPPVSARSCVPPDESYLNACRLCAAISCAWMYNI